MRRIDWECPECGLVISGITPPQECPACGELGELFEPVEYDMDDDEWLEEELEEEVDDESDIDEVDAVVEEDEDEVDLDEEDQAILRAVHEVFGLDEEDDEDEDIDLDLDLEEFE